MCLPTAFADLVTTDVGVPIQISVLANDDDPEDDTITIDFFDAVSTQGGTVTSPAAGILQYTPPSGTFSGADSFTYTINDEGVFMLILSLEGVSKTAS